MILSTVARLTRGQNETPASGVKAWTGTSGKLWENAGISGKNWEPLGDSDRKVGNSGNSWDNWIVPWRTCRAGDSKFLSPALGEMRRPSVPKPVTIGDFEHRKPSHGGPNHFSRPRPDVTNGLHHSRPYLRCRRARNARRTCQGRDVEKVCSAPAMTPLRPTARKPYDAK